MSELVIRYQDPWLVIVDKPPGLPTQDKPGATDDLYRRVRARWPRAALQHRLDQPASGLVLFTVHPDAHGAVTDALRTHNIDRGYLAVLAGPTTAWASPARWDGPIEGDPAVTWAEGLGARRGMIACRFRLETGRHHQIRRHAQAAGTPIVGDHRYGGPAASWAPRLALHAARLAWTHPQTGEPLEVRSPWPEDLGPLWAMAGGPPDPWSTPWDANGGA